MKGEERWKQGERRGLAPCWKMQPQDWTAPWSGQAWHEILCGLEQFWKTNKKKHIVGNHKVCTVATSSQPLCCLRLNPWCCLVPSPHTSENQAGGWSGQGCLLCNTFLTPSLLCSPLLFLLSLRDSFSSLKGLGKSGDTPHLGTLNLHPPGQTCGSRGWSGQELQQPAMLLLCIKQQRNQLTRPA